MNKNNVSKFIKYSTLISIVILIIFQISLKVQPIENNSPANENVNLNYSLEKYTLSKTNTIATNSIPYKLNSLHYTIAEYFQGQKIYVQNSRNNFKSYYLDEKYTSNSDIMSFVSAVDKASSKARLFINTTGIFVLMVIVGFLKFRRKITSISLIAPIKVLVYMFLITGVVIITNLYNDYVSATLEADHRFNIIYNVNIESNY